MMIEEVVSKYDDAKIIPLKGGKCRGYVYTIMTPCISVFYKTNREIDGMSFGDNDYIDDIVKQIESRIYTDEELLSPCKSLKEHNKRVNYLTSVYTRQILTFSSNLYYNRHRADDDVPFPFMEYMYGSLKDKEFIDHCTWLWSELQKLKRPTVFPQFISTLKGIEKAEKYMYLIPLAEPDDMSLPDIYEYLNKHGSRIAKEAFEDNNTTLTRWLIQEGFVKLPTLKKLLEMANNKDDAKFAAFLVDSIGDNCGKESKFSL